MSPIKHICVVFVLNFCLLSFLPEINPGRPKNKSFWYSHHNLILKLPILNYTAIIPKTGKNSHSVSESQQGRNVAQLGVQIATHTKFSPLTLANYGNFCGLGGSGTPIDGVDQCCFKHDNCYGDIMSCTPHLLTYTETNLECKDEGGSCGYKTCFCDVDFINCLNVQWIY